MSVGPQDLEEQVEVAYTRPGDGLGFCAACEGHFRDPDSVPSAALFLDAFPATPEEMLVRSGCFFLAECRILNPEVAGPELVGRVVGQLAEKVCEGWGEMAQGKALAEIGDIGAAR